MADNRARRLSRIAHMQSMLQQASEIRLATLQRDENQVRERQRQLIAALNDPHPAHGLFVNAMAHHLNQLELRLQHLGQAVVDEKQTRLKAELGGRAAEKLSTGIISMQIAGGERRNLEEWSPSGTGSQLPTSKQCHKK